MARSNDSEIQMLIHEVMAIRTSTIANLDAILERLRRMQPEETPSIRVPHGEKASKQFWKDFVANRNA